MRIPRVLVSLLTALMASCIGYGPAGGQEISQREARQAMHRAVSFFRQHAASEGGGYVFRISEDLQKREGEGAVDRWIAWIEPPATPAVGMGYLHAYQLTGDELLRRAAIETADALVRGQLQSGGWDNDIKYDPEHRRDYAYRTEAEPGKRNVTTLDDDKSQSAARFLMSLDQVLEFKNEQIHEAALYAMEAFVRAQHANGAWPQRYSDFSDLAAASPRQASFPEQWSREFPGRDYKSFYTLNDNTMSDMIDTMLLAHQVYAEPRYLEAAKRAGDFFVRAQLPEPQPGWAQQYDHQMQPAWARKFEPPAITGGESQGVMLALMRIYRASGDKKYLEPIPSALAYYRRIQLSDDQLARFYEIRSDRPLYFTKDYKLTYSDSDLPTHYAFKVGSKLETIAQEYQRCRAAPPDARSSAVGKRPQKLRMSESLKRRASEAIKGLDHRGAWVQDGRLRYHGDDDTTERVIESRTFVENLISVAQYLAAEDS